MLLPPKPPNTLGPTVNHKKWEKKMHLFIYFRLSFLWRRASLAAIMASPKVGAGKELSRLAAVFMDLYVFLQCSTHASVFDLDLERAGPRPSACALGFVPPLGRGPRAE